MKKLTHFEMSSKGGKSFWKNKSKKERSMLIKNRWLIRRLKEAVKDRLI